MRAVALLVVFLAVAHAADGLDWCIQPEGGRTGDTCVNDYDCFPLQACAGGVCTASSIGNDCTVDGDCGFVNVGCTEGKCKVRRSLDDTCTSNSECASGICDAGSGQCAGRDLGAECDPMMVPNQCGFQAFCAHTGTCTAALASNADCSEHAGAVVDGTMPFPTFMDVCSGSGYCDGPTGQETCHLVLSSDEGEACGPGAYGCNLNDFLTCAHVDGETLHGTCMREGVEGEACAGGRDCSGGQWCVCNEAGRTSNNGTCTPYYNHVCATEQTNFLLCGIGVRCHRSVASVSMSDHTRGTYNQAAFVYEGSCWNQCLEKQRQFSCCRQSSGFAETYPLPFSCADDDDDDDDDSSAAPARAIAALLPVLAAVGVATLVA